MSTPDFLELDRRFQELTGEVKPEDEALESYTLAFLDHDAKLTWKDLLERRLVVVLGEPGSGKSWEFEHQAERLAEAGQYAFFIELEHLVRQQIDEVLGPEDYRRFQKWLDSEEKATFFLDSVDEAKFRRPTDFHSAIQRLQDSLGFQNLSRARLLVSSRISEWRPQTDREELLRRFPNPHTRKVFKDGTLIEVPPDSKELDIVVKIAPLSRIGVERFAGSRGVPAQEFLAAVDAHHAWEFARRPADIVDLVNYWIEYGQLASFTELMEHSIRCKLRPSERDSGDPLSEQQARRGAEALGAATIFCRQFNFKVPDETYVVPNALDAHSSLPKDWPKEHGKALLVRPIFDSASYGRIRFHHRRIAEYLAAKWLESRMAEGCPKTILDELVFDRFEDRRVLRPALAPVAAWLCAGGESWKEDLRHWVLEASPTIHLVYGDPRRLPLQYKRRLLEALVGRYGKKQRAWIQSSPDALSRLADPALAVDVSTIIRDQSLSSDLRTEMLQLVRHGRLQACLEAALDVIASRDSPRELKTYAVAAIRDVGDVDIRHRLAAIMASMLTIPNSLCSIACEALYPEVIGAAELVKMLRKTQPVPEFSFDLPYYLRSHFKSAVNPDLSVDLLEHLIELGRTSPYVLLDSKEIPISSQFSWLGKVLPSVFEKLFSKPSLDSHEVEVAASALLWLRLHQQVDAHNHDDKMLRELDEGTSRHPSVRQRYFWSLIHEEKLRKANGPARLHQFYGYSEILTLRESDLSWLLEDIEERSDHKDQEQALHLAVDLWNSAGRYWRGRKHIRKTIAKKPNLIRLFRQLAASGPWGCFQRLWYRHFHYPLSTLWQEWWWTRQSRWLRRRWKWEHVQLKFWWHRRTLAAGLRPDWLVFLCRETDEKGHSQLGSCDWNVLKMKRGHLIATAAKLGCKRSWRIFLPPLPHENTSSRIDNRLIAGLVGLQASVDDGEVQFPTISNEDVERATRYAVNEINGFPPWFYDLARQRPESVQKILAECIRGEWLLPAELEHQYQVLHDLVWHGETLTPLVQESILASLQHGDPLNHLILRYALTVLTRRAPELLATLAEERLENLAPDSPTFVLWFAVWLQLDAGQALDVLERRLGQVSEPSPIVMRLCAFFGNERLERGPAVSNPSYLRPLHLRRLIPLIYKHVRSDDDVDRTGGGAYSPIDRDHAQNFRNSLLVRLLKNDSLETLTVLRELKKTPELAGLGEWIDHLIEEWVFSHADLPIWSPTDIRSFEHDYETDPKTDRDLFQIICNRLSEIKLDVEEADNSLREGVRVNDPEPVLRRWLARKLSDRSRGRYTVPQEEEIDQGKKPDLRIENPRTSPVSIEIKWADKWPLRELLERLENQLIGQYLRAHTSRYGIYVLGMIGHKKHWRNLDDTQDWNFEQVIAAITERATQLVSARSDVEDIRVIGIDFQDPGSPKDEVGLC